MKDYRTWWLKGWEVGHVLRNLYFNGPKIDGVLSMEIIESEKDFDNKIRIEEQLWAIREGLA